MSKMTIAQLASIEEKKISAFERSLYGSVFNTTLELPIPAPRANTINELIDEIWVLNETLFDLFWNYDVKTILHTTNLHPQIITALTELLPNCPKLAALVFCNTLRRNMSFFLHISVDTYTARIPAHAIPELCEKLTQHCNILCTILLHNHFVSIRLKGDKDMRTISNHRLEQIYTTILWWTDVGTFFSLIPHDVMKNCLLNELSS